MNDVPVANNDSGIIVEAGSSVGIAPLQNDEDVDGDELQLLGIISGPFHGSMVINADGTLTYNADENYEGEDSMIYRISDNHGGMATASILVDVIGQTSAAASRSVQSSTNASSNPSRTGSAEGEPRSVQLRSDEPEPQFPTSAS